MAKPRMDLSTFVGKLLEEQDGDVLREGVRVLAQALMDTEVTSLVGAERHERSEARTAYRNGTRVRSWDTRVGTILRGWSPFALARRPVPPQSPSCTRAQSWLRSSDSALSNSALAAAASPCAL